MLAGIDDERATVRERTIPAPQRLGVELRRRRVPDDTAAGSDPVCVKGDAARRRRSRHVHFLLVEILMMVDSPAVDLGGGRCAAIVTRRRSSRVSGSALRAESR